MATVFDKLNLKQQRQIVVVDAPQSFDAQLDALLAQTPGMEVRRDLQACEALTFALAFVSTQSALDAVSSAIAQRAVGDAVLWIAYPKQSSKRYRCEFNRDSGWTVLGAAGFEAVRMVAIDEDWSALRFRRAEFIKSLTRDTKRALSSAGKARTART